MSAHLGARWKAGSRVRPTYYLRIQTRDAVGNLAEWETVYRYTTDPVTKYYEFNGRRVALRQGGQVHYLFGDHPSLSLRTGLGSTSLVVDGAGRVVSEVRYRPWGEVRYNPGALSTRYTYTGQYSHLAEFGLYFYNARWYSPTLGRFTQPDSVIPVQSQSVQGLDRYGYVNNNPLRYVDPSGHGCEEIPEGSYARHQCERTQQQQPHKPPQQRDVVATPAPTAPTYAPVPTATPTPTPTMVSDSAASRHTDVPTDLCPTPMPGYPPCFEFPKQAPPPKLSLPEWFRHLDYADLVLDGTGVVLDLFTFGTSGRALNYLEMLGKAVDQTDAFAGMIQVALDVRRGDDDWYTYASFSTDMVGLFMPILPDVVGIGLNIDHAFQLAGR